MNQSIIIKWRAFLLQKRCLLVIVFLLLGGCAEHERYRTSYEVCRVDSSNSSCADSAIQEIKSSKTDAKYLMGFMEFDDQGRIWDRKQMNSVIEAIGTEASKGDVLMVVFVHGWKHSAMSGDENIDTFRGVLSDLADNEERITSQVNEYNRVTGGDKAGVNPRKVVGIYMGWRGGSVQLPVVKELTFWDRKNTAEKVGHGDITEALSRIEQIRLVHRENSNGKTGTRLVVVGHSFGGLVVHSALSQILSNRFVNTTGGPLVSADAEGFGNLVLLINPAFEAQQFSNLSDMSSERGTYFKTQLPVMAVLTSESDLATKWAFPAARFFSTFFEKTHDRKRKNAAIGGNEEISEWDANVKTVGHFDPYITHSLYRAPASDSGAGCPLNMLDVCSAMRADSSWQDDKPGSQIRFDSLLLERNQRSVGRNPYLVVRVAGDLIKGHNDLDEPEIISFVRQLTLISTTTPEQKGVLYNMFSLQ